MNLRKQEGVAIILAMLVVTLAASTAAFALWQQSLWVRQAENLTHRAQAQALSRAAIDWTRGILAQDAEEDTAEEDTKANRELDHLGENWAQPLTALPAETGVLAGRIADQQGMFNLNNLAREGNESRPDVEAFKRLLEQLELPGALANAVLDWIDSKDQDQVTHPGGAEDLDYLALDPPYRAANQPLADVSELYRVKGFDEETVRKLRPFVTALPKPTPLNVNTAPAEVLSAVFLGLSPSDAQGLVKLREQKPFKTKEEFTERLPKSVQNPQALSFDVNSDYFLATVRARVDRVEAAYQALLYRPAAAQGQGAGWPVIISLGQAD